MFCLIVQGHIRLHLQYHRISIISLYIQIDSQCSLRQERILLTVRQNASMLAWSLASLCFLLSMGQFFVILMTSVLLGTGVKSGIILSSVEFFDSVEFLVVWAAGPVNTSTSVFVKAWLLGSKLRAKWSGLTAKPFIPMDKVEIAAKPVMARRRMEKLEVATMLLKLNWFNCRDLMPGIRGNRIEVSKCRRAREGSCELWPEFVGDSTSYKRRGAIGKSSLFDLAST